MDVTDVRVTEEALIAEDGKVACRYRVTGRLGDGRRVASTGTKIYRLAGGKIAEIRGHDHVVVS
jgi:SnoaL-like domain